MNGKESAASAGIVAAAAVIVAAGVATAIIAATQATDQKDPDQPFAAIITAAVTADETGTAAAATATAAE